MKPGRLGRSREYQFTRHNLNDHIITSELVLSLLPQSHFVTTGQGEPTCDLVFNYDVLSETGISSFGTATRRAAFFAPARVSLRPPWVRSPLLSCCHRRVAVRPTPWSIICPIIREPKSSSDWFGVERPAAAVGTASSIS